MAKILFFNFDGTGKDSSDGEQQNNLFGTIEDNNISNILKFHLLLGGKLLHETGNTEIDNGSRTFYYHGIGTYGGFLQRRIESGLAFEFSDVATILRGARKDFLEHYQKPGDYDFIVVTGFSRGAALARRFAAIIDDLVPKPIIFEGVFDTVASIGAPDFDPENRPTSEVVFENGCTLPSNVLKALHLTSLDDKRRAYQPTLMNQDQRVTEIWFAGAHSDVGGGYYYDGLSDNALQFFLNWFENQKELDLTFKKPDEIDYGGLFNGEQLITLEDVEIDPNPNSINHQQHLPVIDRLIFSDRKCCVIRDDEIVPDLPALVHHSVAERIYKVRDYRPNSLKCTKHLIYYQDGNTLGFDGISEHIRAFHGEEMEPDKEGVNARVYAYIKYNHTNIHLEAGKHYKIEVIDQDKQQWRDGDLQAVDGRGWNRDSVQLGFLRESLVAASEPFRRVNSKKADWFTLCGCIDEDDKHSFVIGNSLDDYVPEKSGELCAFANDVGAMYNNNSGYLKVKVTAL